MALSLARKRLASPLPLDIQPSRQRRRVEDAVFLPTVPVAPNIVYALQRTLVFSFVPVEDVQVVAYEVLCRARGIAAWTGSWSLRPVQFDANSLGVRTGRLWVVTLSQLSPKTQYTLQLRSVTVAGHVSEWSRPSVRIQTRKADSSGPFEADIGVNENACLTDVTALAHAQDTPQLAQLSELVPLLERSLSVIIGYAIGGIQVGGVEIPSISEWSRELVRQQGTVAGALESVPKIVGKSLGHRGLEELLFRCAPVLGCPAALLLDLWRNLRHCALVAHLNGHDPSSDDTQAAVLLCLCVSNVFVSVDVSAEAKGALARATTHVAHALAKEALQHISGTRQLATVLDVFVAMGQIICLAKSTQESVAISNPVKAAMAVFKRPEMHEQAPYLGLLTCAWLLPIVRSFIAILGMALRSKARISVFLAFPLVLCSFLVGIAVVLWVQSRLVEAAQSLVTLLFFLHASMLSVSSCGAMMNILSGAPPYLIVLGLYNLIGACATWAHVIESREGDQVGEGGWSQYVVQASPYLGLACRALWYLLLWDAVLEQLLGNILRVHSIAVLCPPNVQTLGFLARLLSSWAQVRLGKLMQRPIVWIRLLGAKSAILAISGASVGALLAGTVVAAQPRTTLHSLIQALPTPKSSCGILVLRRHSVIIGLLLGVALHLFQRCTPIAIGAATCVVHFICYYLSAASMRMWARDAPRLKAESRIKLLCPQLSCELHQRAVRLVGGAGVGAAGALVRRCLPQPQ